MRTILEEIDTSWLDWVCANPGYLTVALTGGGASLPMVRQLSEGEIVVHGRSIQIRRALSFPNWLQDAYPALEDSYPRIAVSLGGARRRLIQAAGTAKITAGDVTLPHKLEGYYQKGM